MTNIDRVLKSRDDADKGPYNWGYILLSGHVRLREVKKAECQRMYAFELWCWRRLLKVPWTVRRSILNIHWKGWCWSSSILVIWCEQMTPWKVPDAGKDWEQKEKMASEDEVAGWRHWCNGHELWQTLGVWRDREAWCGVATRAHRARNAGWLNNNNVTTTVCSSYS